MKVLEVDSEVKRRLFESGITKIMKSIESCDWVVIEEEEGGVRGLYRSPRHDGKIMLLVSVAGHFGGGSKSQPMPQKD